MELPDEAVGYQYQSLLLPVGEEWTPAAEIRTRHYLHPARLKDLGQRLMQAKSEARMAADHPSVFHRMSSRSARATTLVLVAAASLLLIAAQQPSNATEEQAKDG